MKLPPRMLHRMSASGLALIALLLLPIGMPALAATVGATTHRLTFADLKGDNAPLQLRGMEASNEIILPIPERQTLHAATLQLRLINSVALQSNSQVAVSVNGLTVAQIPLRGQEPQVTARITLPIEQLKPGYNRIGFAAAQHYAPKCEYPAAPELWTEINAEQSVFEIESSPIAKPPTLSALPQVFDKRSWEKPELVVLTAATPDAPLLQATAQVAQGVGAMYEYVPIRIHHAPLPAPAGHTASPAPAVALPSLPAELGGKDVILIGTTEQLSPYLGAGIASAISTPYLAIHPHPTQAGRSVLVISGTTSEEVHTAAGLFATRGFVLPDAPETTVQALNLPPLPEKALVGGLIAGVQLKLTEFGVNSRTLSGMSPAPAEIRFWNNAAPFALARQKIRLKLHLAYAAGMSNQSVLNVMLNGVMARSVALDNPAGGSFEDYTIDMLVSELKPGWNTLSLKPELMPLDRGGECKALFDKNLKLTLFDDSTLELIGTSNTISFPGLGLFAGTALPHAQRPDGSRFAVLVSETDSATLSGALTVLAKLAQVNRAPMYRLWFGTGQPPVDRHLLIIGKQDSLPSPHRETMQANLEGDIHEQLELGRARTAPTFLQRKLLDLPVEWRMALGITMPKPEPILAEAVLNGGYANEALAMTFAHPQNRERVVTVMTASSGQQLEAGLARLVQHSHWGQLHDNFALWRPDGELVRSGHVGTGRMYEYGLRSGIGMWLYFHPWLGLGSVFLLIMLLAWVSLRLLSRYRRSHHSTACEMP